MRTEQEIFNDLECLASENGFLEVLAFICFKDTYLILDDEGLNSQTFAQTFDKSKLSRTELSTLVGLASKNFLTNEVLTQDQIISKCEKVYTLFEELHQAFLNPEDIYKMFSEKDISTNIFKSGTFMREAIFYSGEGAFKHQYRDLSKIRYANDDHWLEQNKGFKIAEIVQVISAIEKIQLDNANYLMSSSTGELIKSFLPIFQFKVDDIVLETGLPISIVKAAIESLSALPQDGMDCFKSVDDFNHRNAYPIIKLEDGSFLSFQIYSLWAAIYETPFFWFNSDDSYKVKAADNRGEFTENFTADRLALVFGSENVFTNIHLYKNGDEKSEIDVLVTFGHIALVVQAKSKKLTIPARKGNSQILEDDFKKAVHRAYDQALLCSKLLEEEDTVFKNENGEVIHINNNSGDNSGFKIIIPICIGSEHYPALSAQARNFLKIEVTETIKHPYVIDVFLIDMITEMLSTPILLLDFLIKRSDFGHSILSNHELTILSMYIKYNLYFEDNPSLVYLDDEISGDLELSMWARRDKIAELPTTPEGLLTLHKDTYIGSILEDVANSKEYGAQCLAFLLLSLNGETINLINDCLLNMINQYKKDGKNHDITLPISEGKTGLTIHCNDDELIKASSILVSHCERKKYSFSANSWVGFCFSPTKLKYTFATYLEYEWQRSDEIDKLMESLPKSKSHNLADVPNIIRTNNMSSQVTSAKIGRNEKCSCGSEKKYKKCCGF